CPPYKSLRRRHRPALMRHQQSPDLRSRYRRAEQKTLHLRAAELAQHLALPFLLDAFRRRRHVAGGGDVHDGLDDRGRRALVGDALDEGAVDLDLDRKSTRLNSSHRTISYA